MLKFCPSDLEHDVGSCLNYLESINILFIYILIVLECSESEFRIFRVFAHRFCLKFEIIRQRLRFTISSSLLFNSLSWNHFRRIIHLL